METPEHNYKKESNYYFSVIVPYFVLFQVIAPIITYFTSGAVTALYQNILKDHRFHEDNEKFDSYLVKRIAALPGEKVKNYWGHERIVPDRHVWCLGDNADESLDSRQIGPIPLDRIGPWKLLSINDKPYKNDKTL